MMMMARARHSLGMAAIQSRHGVAVASTWGYWRIIALFKWLLACVSDERGLSLTKFVAIFCCLLLYHDVMVHERPVNGNHNFTLIIAGSLAFGRMAWLAFLKRNEFKTENKTEVKADMAQVIHAITERRDHEHGFEPSP